MSAWKPNKQARNNRESEFLVTHSGILRFAYHAMHEPEFFDDTWRYHGWIGVLVTHAAAKAVERERERYPMIDQCLDARFPIGVEGKRAFPNTARMCSQGGPMSCRTSRGPGFENPTNINAGFWFLGRPSRVEPIGLMPPPTRRLRPLEAWRRRCWIRLHARRDCVLDSWPSRVECQPGPGLGSNSCPVRKAP